MDCNCKERVVKDNGQRSMQKYLVKCTPEMFVEEEISFIKLNQQWTIRYHPPSYQTMYDEFPLAK